MLGIHGGQAFGAIRVRDNWSCLAMREFIYFENSFYLIRISENRFDDANTFKDGFDVRILRGKFLWLGFLAVLIVSGTC